MTLPENEPRTINLNEVTRRLANIALGVGILATIGFGIASQKYAELTDKAEETELTAKDRAENQAAVDEVLDESTDLIVVGGVGYALAYVLRGANRRSKEPA